MGEQDEIEFELLYLTLVKLTARRLKLCFPAVVLKLKDTAKRTCPEAFGGSES
jgi:hypothetical protein